MGNEGLLLQMDGSHHRWNGKDEWVLIAMIDDATSDIPYAEFFHSEDTWNCLAILQRSETITRDAVFVAKHRDHGVGAGVAIAPCNFVLVRAIIDRLWLGRGRKLGCETSFRRRAEEALQ